MDRIPMTAEGYATLEAELKHCRDIERPRIIQQIVDARGAEDLSENVEYHLATELQSVNDARIVELEDKLARAEIIDISKLSRETITFGATVTLIDENTGNRSCVADCRETGSEPEEEENLVRLAARASASRKEERL